MDLNPSNTRFMNSEDFHEGKVSDFGSILLFTQTTVTNLVKNAYHTGCLVLRKVSVQWKGLVYKVNLGTYALYLEQYQFLKGFNMPYESFEEL